MTDETILTHLDDEGILTVTFNAPAVKNAIGTAAQRQLVGILIDAARDPGVRVGVLAGAGDSFCTGADVRSMGAPDPGDPLAQKWGDTIIWQQVEARVARLRQFSQASVLLPRMGKPTIARLRGPAAGMGFAMALSSSRR